MSNDDALSDADLKALAERMEKASTVMMPPKTVVDAAAWDQWWRDQVEYGLVGFIHMFVNDGQLVDAMRANGFRTVLCVGNGLTGTPGTGAGGIRCHGTGPVASRDPRQS